MVVLHFGRGYPQWVANKRGGLTKIFRIFCQPSRWFGPAKNSPRYLQKVYECAVWVIAVFLAGHGSSRKLDFREESIELRVAFSPLQGGRKGELDGRHGDHFFDGAPCWLGPVDVNATNVH